MPIDWLKGQDVNALIHALNRIRRQENGKVSFRTFSFEELAETLSSAVQLPSDVPYEHRKAAVRDALCQVTASGRLTKDQMINKIREHIEAYLALPAVDFWIRTSWSANIFTPELKSLSVDNSKLLFAKIPKRFDQDDISESARRYHDICVPVHYPPILIHVKARCEYSAINSALDASDPMRALVNFILNRRSFRRTCSGPRQPVNLILPGPLHTVHRRDGSLIPPNMYWYNPRHFVVKEKTS